MKHPAYRSFPVSLFTLVCRQGARFNPEQPRPGRSKSLTGTPGLDSPGWDHIFSLETRMATTGVSIFSWG